MNAHDSSNFEAVAMSVGNLDDDDWDDDSDDEDGDEPTISCPHCRREIPEDVAQCPYCEQYTSTLDAPPAQKSWWLILGVIVCLYLVYRWTFG